MIPGGILNKSHFRPVQIILDQFKFILDQIKSYYKSQAFSKKFKASLD